METSYRTTRPAVNSQRSLISNDAGVLATRRVIEESIAKDAGVPAAAELSKRDGPRCRRPCQRRSRNFLPAADTTKRRVAAAGLPCKKVKPKLRAGSGDQGTIIAEKLTGSLLLYRLFQD